MHLFCMVLFVCARARACARACVRMRACVRACARACVCVSRRRSMRMLTRLVTLHASDNKLRAWPACLACSTQLTDLQLNNNLIDEVPACVCVCVRACAGGRACGRAGVRAGVLSFSPSQTCSAGLSPSRDSETGGDI